MDLPVFRKGLELVSAQLNKLSQGIRAAQVTSVVGGSFTRTPAGTTIIVGAQPGGGGGSTAPYCSFKVQDYTKPTDNDLIVSVQQDKINGRYPLGMDGEGGTFTVAIPNQWAENTSWVGIYIIIKVDEFGNIRPEPEAIRVAPSLRPLDGLESNQTFLLADVTIDLDKTGKPYIANIVNSCPLIEPVTNGLCPFQISDVFNSITNPPAIQIRTGNIEGRYPDGMSIKSLYELEIPDDGEWHAVYCVLLVDSNGNILPDATSITFGLYNEWQTNTATTQYVLIGEVTTSYLPNPFANRYISFIQNYCLIPAPQRSTNVLCPFEATNASNETQQRVEIKQGTVATGNPYNPYQWPDGMGIGYPPYYLEITESGYIYCKFVFNTPSYLVSSDPTGITFLFSSSLLPNTETDQYFLMATIEFDAEIKNISNVCTSPVPDPCSLIYVPL